MDEDDTLSWAYTPNECYNVKYGYQNIKNWNKNNETHGYAVFIYKRMSNNIWGS